MSVSLGKVFAISEKLAKQFSTNSFVRSYEKSRDITSGKVVHTLVFLDVNKKEFEVDLVFCDSNKIPQGYYGNFSAISMCNNNTYELLLVDKSLQLPEMYSVNFISPKTVQDNAKMVILNPHKYLDNKYSKRLLSGEFTKSVESIVVSTDGYVNLKTTVGDRNAELKSNVKAKDILKPNTDYTLILDIKDKRNDCWLYVNILSTTSPLYVKETYTSQSGIVKLKLTTRNEIDNADLFYFRHTAVNDKEQYNCEFKAWLVEGDYTNKDIKITANSEIILSSDYKEKPIITYGVGETPIKQGQFGAGQPITLNITNNASYF